MQSATQSPVQNLSKVEPPQTDSGLFSSESVLNILKLILAGSELSEVLTIIARSVESRGNGTLCTIWLPDADGKHLHCAAAPSLPGFAENVGPHVCSARMAHPAARPCIGESRSMSPISSRESIWDDYRDRVLPYGIRAVWSRPLFTREGTVLGTFAILYREVRNPDALDLQLIEMRATLQASQLSGTFMNKRCGMNAIGCACFWKSPTARHRSSTCRI